MNATTRTRTPGLAATFEDERYAWTRRTRVRRAGVLGEAALLGAVLTLALLAAFEVVPLLPSVIAWTAGFLAFIPLHSVVNLGVRGVFDRRATTLDEVQRTMRDVSSAAVNPLRVALGLVAVVAAVAVALHAPVPTQGYAVGFALWFATWLLSTWHLAWTLPSEDD